MADELARCGEVHKIKKINPFKAFSVFLFNKLSNSRIILSSFCLINIHVACFQFIVYNLISVFSANIIRKVDNKWLNILI